MSFKETDFPGLIGYLKRIVAEEKDPLLFKEMVSELVKMYDKIPVYPGIVNMCLGGLARSVRPEEVEVGQKIFIKNREDCFCGTVSEKNADGVVIKAVKSVASEDDLEIGFREMEKVTLINGDVLEEMWPSLVFDKEQS
ncbi:MAG: hypothetical protein PWR01_4385 [Clostridiales bacterium]|jgi:hypothetical protein|nr:hypothetical protein [Clostridiales bacterium]MDN5283312.1 hypothetical protein [Candidatus Ozemobacter sp.]